MTLPPELNSLPYMSERDLVGFLRERPHLRLTPDEREYLFLRRRRMSLDLDPTGDKLRNMMIRTTGPYVATGGSGSPGIGVYGNAGMGGGNGVIPGHVGGLTGQNVLKIVVLGDEFEGPTSVGPQGSFVQQLSGKDDLIHLFSLPEWAQSLPPVDIHRVPFYYHDQRLDVDHASSQMYELELWLPHCTGKHDSLRPHYYPATDLFIIVFSVKSRKSFENVKNRWSAEINRFIVSQPKREVPVILVGNHAEARKSFAANSSNGAAGGSPGSTNAGRFLVDAQEAVELAQQMGFMKYIEVYSDNRTHVVEVFRQGVREIVRSRLENTRMHPDDYRVEFGKEDAILRRHLTLAEPTGYFDPFKRSFVIETGIVVGDPNVGSAVSGTFPGVDDEAVTYTYTTDGSEPTRLSAVYEGPLKLKRPYPEGIRVKAFSRCRYASRTSYFRVPEETPPPHAHFDVLPHLMYSPGYRFGSASFSAGAAPAQGIHGSTGLPTFGFVITPQEGTRFFFTLDGTRPNINSEATYGGYLRLVVPENATGSSSQGSQLDSTAVESPSKLPVVKVIAVRDGMLASRVAEFLPPTILPIPNIQYDPSSRIFAIEQSYSVPNVEFRYTVDGTEPSYGSLLYAGPVMITGNDVVIRVAAMPKLYVPSPVVSFLTNPTATANSVYLSSTVPPGSPQGSSPSTVLRLSQVPSSQQRSDPSGPVQVVPLTASSLGALGHSPPRQRIASGDVTSIASLNEPSIPVRDRKPIKGPATPRDVQTSLRHKPLSQLYSDKNNSVQDLRGGGSPSSPRRLDSPRTSSFRSAQQQHSPAPHSPSSHSPAQRAPSPPRAGSSASSGTSGALAVESQDVDPSLISCVQEPNSLVFTFAVPVAVEKVVVSCPGGGQGPSEVSLFGAAEGESAEHVLQRKPLQDAETEQDCFIPGETRPLTTLRCVFTPQHGASGFMLRDIRVVGKATRSSR
jgi:hypothetical protein